MFVYIWLFSITYFSLVCGLKWSPDNQYLASGGNDNKLFVWNSSSIQPVHTFTEHLAAVKAIAWSPHHPGLLASGGGTADRCIRFWNTLTGQVGISDFMRFLFKCDYNLHLFVIILKKIPSSYVCNSFVFSFFRQCNP